MAPFWSKTDGGTVRPGPLFVRRRSCRNGDVSDTHVVFYYLTLYLL